MSLREEKSRTNTYIPKNLGTRKKIHWTENFNENWNGSAIFGERTSPHRLPPLLRHGREAGGKTVSGKTLVGKITMARSSVER